MFKEGDEVIVTANSTYGTVLEVDDGIAYLEMANGVEMDYPVGALVLAADHKSPWEEDQQKENSETDPELLAKAELIYPSVRELLVVMAMLQAEQAGLAVVLLGGSALPWPVMNDYHRMNFICVATNTTFEHWVAAYDENRLEKFQLGLIATIGMTALK